MLLKIMGSVLIVVCGGGLGMYYGAAYELRKGELEQLKRALMLMYSETEFGHTHLAPMCEKALEVCDSVIGNIFNDFSIALTERTTESIAEMWKDCVEQNMIHTHLAAEDADVIANLGSNLGAVDINRQLTAIKCLITYIDLKCEELANISSKNMRLYKSTGVLLGAFAVILLF